MSSPPPLSLLVLAFFAYVDLMLFRRVSDLLSDQRTARRICDGYRARGEGYPLLTWHEAGLTPKSGYFWRLDYVAIADSSRLPHVEAFGLVGLVVAQVIFCVLVGKAALSFLS